MPELALINKNYIDRYLRLTDEEAMDIARRLAGIEMSEYRFMAIIFLNPR